MAPDNPAFQPVDPPMARPAAERTGHAWPWLRRWIERRHAARCCRRLRRLHDEVRRDEPGLPAQALYARIVQRHLGIDALAAGRVLELAADSYTRWPDERPLTFRDIAHYLAIAGLCDGPGGQSGVVSDVRPVINRWLPSSW